MRVVALFSRLHGLEVVSFQYCSEQPGTTLPSRLGAFAGQVVEEACKTSSEIHIQSGFQYREGKNRHPTTLPPILSGKGLTLNETKKGEIDEPCFHERGPEKHSG